MATGGGTRREPGMTTSGRPDGRVAGRQVWTGRRAGISHAGQCNGKVQAGAGAGREAVWGGEKGVGSRPDTGGPAGRGPLGGGGGGTEHERGAAGGLARGRITGDGCGGGKHVPSTRHEGGNECSGGQPPEGTGGVPATPRGKPPPTDVWRGRGGTTWADAGQMPAGGQTRCCHGGQRWESHSGDGEAEGAGRRCC